VICEEFVQVYTSGYSIMESSVTTLTNTNTSTPATSSNVAATSESTTSSSTSPFFSTISTTNTTGKTSLAGGYAGDPMTKYGTHQCTCDGCNARPIIGFRYKCLKVS
jgi:hypothetical protein